MPVISVPPVLECGGALVGVGIRLGVSPLVQRRLDEALDLQYRLLKLFDAMLFTAEFPEGVRAALRLRGFKTGDGRQPQSANQQLQLDRLSDQLQCLRGTDATLRGAITYEYVIVPGANLTV